MAKDVYCDQTLASGSDNGTSWINAYKLLTTALNGSNVVAGDTLWVKNDATVSSEAELFGVANYTNDPPRVIGVRSDTTRTPPIPADIIPGLRNGSSTRAYDQVSANAPPIFEVDSSGQELYWRGSFGLMYGIHFKTNNSMLFGKRGDGVILFEECRFEAGIGNNAKWQLEGFSADAKFDFKRCEFLSVTDTEFKTGFEAGFFTWDECDLISSGTVQWEAGGGYLEITGCDLSNQSTPVFVTLTAHAQGTHHIQNCKLHGSTVLSTGPTNDRYRIELAQASGVGSKTTGESFLEMEINASEGNIIVETTAVRTGGADDGGDGAWSMAFTPDIDHTRDNLVGLEGPWITQAVEGDGTSKTLAVHISNDLSEDAGNKYNDDDVWIELWAPSETGTAQYDFYSTQMNLEASPTEITTETVGWGAGAANDQRLSIAFSPDYSGDIRWRLIFGKHFGATPDTLYLDPIGVIS